MKILLVDGTWCLKKNFHKRRDLVNSKRKPCGGTFGFLDSLKSVINKTMPDRVVVFWDGFNSGKLRYNIYKPYKAKRKKNFENEIRVISTEGIGSDKDNEDFQMLIQKIDTQTYLEELFVRQCEEDYIEADDLIAYYIIGNDNKDDEILIYSRDKDFLQLIDEKVSILTPDNFEIININNFKEKVGFTIENALLIKCIEGDDSDEITGIGGVKRDTLFKHFPDMINERYTFKRLTEEAYAIQNARINGKPKKKRLMQLDKIIESENIVYRNAILMNLKKPFLNEDAILSVDSLRNNALDSDRSIEVAMNMFATDGYHQFLINGDLNYFFGPFYALKAKEKEFESKII